MHRRASEPFKEAVHPKVRYAAVAAMAEQGLSIQIACRVLALSESESYDGRSRPPLARSIRHAWTTDQITEIHQRSRVLGRNHPGQQRICRQSEVEQNTPPATPTYKGRSAPPQWPAPKIQAPTSAPSTTAGSPHVADPQKANVAILNADRHLAHGNQRLPLRRPGRRLASNQCRCRTRGHRTGTRPRAAP